MKTKDLWENTLQFISHAYWDKKERFKLSCDTYSSWVVFIVESGSFQYQIGQETGTVEHDELVFCPPGYAFHREALSPLTLHFIAFDFEVPLKKINNEFQMPTFKSQPADRNRLMSNISYLRTLHLSMDQRSVFRKQWMLNDLWQLACEDWSMMLPRYDDIAFMTHTDDQQMKWAMNWLIRNAYTSFSMSELSELISLSPVQFTRRFQKAFNMCPSELVRSVRIRKVAKLLLDSELTLDQIAERCGYDNGFYLSRVFTRYMGISPSKYRQQNRV
ncbi:AraC family transcriptional regulator [Neobacillus dielmonensis]|uniref:AraC family transcriptional regulator n=1 Tax=Neobacillus dielmonensis TaxID=1347369 RepID=UPI0005A7B8EF|nr:AraC family transcriptional regulator [Neobacillus dielmonensis]